jgi:hypothetical protein
MTGKQTPDRKKVRLYPPPSKDFDPFTATKDDLMRHGLPLRPDRQTQPGMAALWDRQAARYRRFDHLEPRPDTTTAAKKPVTAPALGPDPIESCGYQLFSASAPFTALFVTWTVPNLRFTPSPIGVNHFHTFVGLGFLDVHVEMTVDSAQNVTSQIWAQSIGQINLPVRPGDVISGSLCLQTNQAGTASYFRQRDHIADDQLRGRHRVPPCGHHQRGRHSQLAPQPTVPPTGQLWGRLLRRDQRLHDEWLSVAHIGRGHHHGRSERQDPR